MNRKSMLAVAVLLLALVGIGAIAFTFLSSLKPTATAGADLPRVNVSKMERGDFKFIDRGPMTGSATRYFVYKTAGDTFHVFELPLKDGIVRLPDLSWRSAWLFCEDFGVETQVSDNEKNQVLRCRDRGENTWWWGNENVWALTGENVGVHGGTDALQSVNFSVEGDTLIIGKR